MQINVMFFGFLIQSQFEACYILEREWSRLTVFWVDLIEDS
jgi:hypothetical protein